ncbi:MAG: MbnP family copper-binding protein [Thiofilum sp.]|uniref:MbnP family copper-binding protein n=1 Tax=Thiofilum sp. TaxID=2212733 RepID=UPI0025F7608A|nr:MbnP family copper-binding protein [Thiofilum sp.]MBK8452791.1 metallo-mystery pair system four-Cys motif protein [Thiofilum sp.]
MSNFNVPILAVLVASALSLSACGGGGGSGDTPTVNLTIPFQAVANGVSVNCAATLPTLGNTGDSGKVSDFAFYVHGVKLKTNIGETIDVTLTDNNFQDPQYGVALLDFQDKTDACQGATKPINTSIAGSAKVDLSRVNGIEFIVGVPAAANHHNASTSRAPYNRAGLMWSWQSGHKFMRLDVNPSQKVTKADLTQVSTFNFHLGSTGCTGDPTTGQVVSCTAPNRKTISLTTDFSANSTTNTTSKIVLDYGKLIAGVNINLETGGAVGCMSGTTDPECPTMFSNLGMAHPLQAGAAASQQVFSVSNQ